MKIFVRAVSGWHSHVLSTLSFQIQIKFPARTSSFKYPEMKSFCSVFLLQSCRRPGTRQLTNKTVLPLPNMTTGSWDRDHSLSNCYFVLLWVFYRQRSISRLFRPIFFFRGTGGSGGEEYLKIFESTICNVFKPAPVNISLKTSIYTCQSR